MTKIVCETHYCDRCNNQIVPYNANGDKYQAVLAVQYERLDNGLTGTDGGKSYKIYELCNKCTKDFDLFVKNSEKKDD